MKDLVTIYDGEPVINSYDIANGFERSHKGILEVINKPKHKAVLEKFGRYQRLKIKTKGRPIEGVLLNEGQALYIGTILRESGKTVDRVTIFKMSLIKEFLRMKKVLLNIETRNKEPEHIEVRDFGKVLRKLSTDAMQQFETYAKEQGSTNYKRYTVNFTKMENSLLFIVRGKYKNLRDVMSNDQLMTIGVADRMIRDVIIKGMNDNVYYKDIYKQAREKVAEFAKVNGQSNILDLIDVNPQIQLSLSS